MIHNIFPNTFLGWEIQHSVASSVTRHILLIYSQWFRLTTTPVLVSLLGEVSLSNRTVTRFTFAGLFLCSHFESQQPGVNFYSKLKPQWGDTEQKACGFKKKKEGWVGEPCPLTVSFKRKSKVSKSVTALHKLWSYLLKSQRLWTTSEGFPDAQ